MGRGRRAKKVDGSVGGEKKYVCGCAWRKGVE